MWGRRDKNDPSQERNQPMNTPDQSGPQGTEPGPESESQDQDLERRLADLEAERHAINEKYLRTLADYHNSQRRAVSNEREARLQGVSSVVLNVLPVLDHFDLALAQDPGKATAQQIAGGVKLIRDELMRVLQNHGVALINPEPNEEFDPNRHQAVMQAQAEGIEPGHVVQTLQPGYAMGERIIRPAKVTVQAGG
jgi:molecular chaperone GrpE